MLQRRGYLKVQVLTEAHSHCGNRWADIIAAARQCLLLSLLALLVQQYKY
jgi:hypothetical protein